MRGASHKCPVIADPRLPPAPGRGAGGGGRGDREPEGAGTRVGRGQGASAQHSGANPLPQAGKQRRTAGGREGKRKEGKGREARGGEARGGPALQRVWWRGGGAPGPGPRKLLAVLCGTKATLKARGWRQLDRGRTRREGCS